MADLVTRLLAALTDERPRRPRSGRRTRTRACGRSTSPTPATSSAAPSVVDDMLGRLAGEACRAGSSWSSAARARASRAWCGRACSPWSRAGDVPGSQRWYVTTMVPGDAPFKELAEALRRVAVSTTESASRTSWPRPTGHRPRHRQLVPEGGQLLLVVDQLEELFTLRPSGSNVAFLAGLVQAVTAADSRLRVVATLRADFFDRPLAVQPFGGLVLDATVPDPGDGRLPSSKRRSSSRRRRVDRQGRGPARRRARRRRGRRTGRATGAAVHALRARRAVRGRPDTVGVQALGGLGGAIAARAEALYSSLDDEERAAVRHLFEQLRGRAPDGEPTRRRALPRRGDRR